MSSCVVVLWAPGHKHSGQNNEGGSCHFVTNGSSNWAAFNPLPGFCLGWSRKLESRSDSDCWATSPLQWKWFSPVRSAPTHCHFKVTTSAPLYGSDKLASNTSFSCGTLRTLFKHIYKSYIIWEALPRQLNIYNTTWMNEKFYFTCMSTEWWVDWMQTFPPVTYSFRDNLLLWLPNLEGNPEMTQKKCTGDRHKQLAWPKRYNYWVISWMTRGLYKSKRRTCSSFRSLTWTVWSC